MNLLDENFDVDMAVAGRSRPEDFRVGVRVQFLNKPAEFDSIEDWFRDCDSSAGAGWVDRMTTLITAAQAQASTFSVSNTAAGRTGGPTPTRVHLRGVGLWFPITMLRVVA